GRGTRVLRWRYHHEGTLLPINRPAPCLGLTMTLIHRDGGDISKQHAQLDQQRLRSQSEHGQVIEVSSLQSCPHLMIEVMLQLLKLLGPEVRTCVTPKAPPIPKSDGVFRAGIVVRKHRLRGVRECRQNVPIANSCAIGDNVAMAAWS